MRLHLLSDLHLEFGKMPRAYEAPACDVVVLAGDIGTGRSGMAWAMEVYPPSLPVIYVCGNHELYGRSMALYEELRAKAATTPNIKFLENESTAIDGVLFHGGTLWTDFDLLGDPVRGGINARFTMNDFRHIDGMTIQLWLDRNRMAQQALQKAGEGDVVITHHAPSARSIPVQFSNDDDTNPAYASHQLERMTKKPKLWIHGHTHTSFDYVQDGTRVVCNPRGYAGHELNPKFNPQLVVEI